jgi:hypothetical protein
MKFSTEWRVCRPVASRSATAPAYARQAIADDAGLASATHFFEPGCAPDIRVQVCDARPIGFCVRRRRGALSAPHRTFLRATVLA